MLPQAKISSMTRRCAAVLFAAGMVAAGGCSAVGRKVDGAALSRRLGPYQPGQTLKFHLGSTQPSPDSPLSKWPQQYARLTTAEKIAYCIHQLRNERCRSMPGSIGYRWFPPRRYTGQAERCPTDELIRIGKPAVPALIAALDDTTQTQILPARMDLRTWEVQDAALYVLEKMACRNFGQSGILLHEASAEEKARIRSEVLAWWRQNRHLDEVAWAKAALRADGDAIAAVWNLYARMGPKCYPALAEAFGRLPKGRDEDDSFDPVALLKGYILWTSVADPNPQIKPVFHMALDDAPIWIRVRAADGLWKLGDSAGVKRMISEMRNKYMSDQGDWWLEDSVYIDILNLLVSSEMPQAREIVFECLRCRNPYLRVWAIWQAERMGMEKAVRALPELFDDPWIVSESHTSHVGQREVVVPPTQICDRAAEAFSKLVPDSPRFGGDTDERQRESIRAIAEWYRANRDKLIWNGKVLKLRSE